MPLLLCIAGTASGQGRAAFVNPLAGRAYHAVRRCSSMRSALWEGMTAMTPAMLMHSPYGGYPKCEFCFSETEQLGSPIPYGQLGEEGVFYPLWQPEDLQTRWTERRIGEFPADLNHDGLPDRVEVYVYPDDPDKSPEQIVQDGGVAFFKVFLAEDSEARFVSRGVSDVHVANGTLLLCRAEGKDYLLECSFYQGQGEGTYRYTAFWIDDALGIVQEEKKAFDFRTGEAGADDKRLSREEILPAFRDGLNHWAAGAVLLASADADHGVALAQASASPVLDALLME